MARRHHYTEWAAFWAVAAELSRREFIVATTVGNTPKFDLSCSSSNGENQFRVQVKGTSLLYGTWVQKHLLEDLTQADLFFVIVFVPEPELPFRFFIMTHKEVKEAWVEWCKQRKDARYYISMCKKCWSEKYPDPKKQPIRFNNGEKNNCRYCGKEYESGLVLTRNDGKPYAEGYGILWSAIEKHENRWDKFERPNIP